MGAALTRLLSYPDKILATFFLKILPEILRFIIIFICVTWNYYKLGSSNYRYMSLINKRSSKFVAKEEALGGCSICLTEFEAGDKCREIVDCKHAFHKSCLEKWLNGYHATCPLCRSLVVPEEIAAEYYKMQIEYQNDGFQKELGLIFLNVLHNGICNGAFSSRLVH